MTFKKLGFWGKAMVKLFGHPAIDYGIDNTVARWAFRTPMKTDDHLVEKFVRPTIHKLFDDAMNKFAGISITDYFKNLWNNALNEINSVEILDTMIEDLEVRKQNLKEEK